MNAAGQTLTASELPTDAAPTARVVVTAGAETFEVRAVLVSSGGVALEIDDLGLDEETPAEALLRRFVAREINATELRRLADEIL